MLEHGPVVTAGPVAEGAGQPGFRRAGRAGEQQVLMPLDPLATGQALEQGTIEAASGVMIVSEATAPYCGLLDAQLFFAGAQCHGMSLSMRLCGQPLTSRVSRSVR
jgi:hypothetical protein